MRMTAETRAIDKIFRRRDRYDIPDWQREKVWDKPKKQKLIDSILKGWKLPKFYFVQVSEDNFLVEDGQQRLAAIFDFFSNTLSLSDESIAQFGGPYYRNLPRRIADTFDDFEIEFDVIVGASDAELKEFFQRLQAGVMLNSSEKLNAVHSKLRDFCRTTSKVPFFSQTVAIPNTRYAHFDIVTKVAAIETEGLGAGLRFDDVKAVFVSQANFSPTSAIAKRIRRALEILQTAFDGQGEALRSRTIVQSLVTLTCKIVSTGRFEGTESALRDFFLRFMKELKHQVELGPNANDSDYLTFQQSINANVRVGPRVRQEILLRKLFTLSPGLAEVFDPSVVAEAGITGRIASVGEAVATLVGQVNSKYAGATGHDLFKPTNKTTAALQKLRKPITTLQGYKDLLDDLYFLFWEGPGNRLEGKWPQSFLDVNELRTDQNHDVDHGKASKVRAKRRKLAAAFVKYAGSGTPDTIDPHRFSLVQANLLGSIEGDLRALLAAEPTSN